MFKLTFDIPPLPTRISLQDRVLLVGSCFSKNVGRRLVDHKFQSVVNPFGTTYNPMSIFRLLDSSFEGEVDEDAIFEQDGVYYSWDTHSALSHPDRAELSRMIAAAHDSVRQLKQRSWIIVTPGTAWVYERKVDGRLVANCHRMPEKEFNKRLLSKEEILDAFGATHKRVSAINSETNWLFTVSPVRHIRDGLVENNRSKAILQDAIHSLVERYENCFYFPSYEIVIDELRDYRFYDRDLVHPNELAIDYVWDQFCDTCLDEGTADFVREWRDIRKAIAHRPKHPGSSAHQKFLNATILRLKRLENKIDIADELLQLQSQLNA